MTHRTRTTRPLFALLIGAAATAALLLATRPAPSHAGASWSDDLAVALVWWGAVIASIWFAITTLACVAALARGRTRAAHRISRLAPPLARRVLQAALISTWALVPTAAYASPPSTPITVHADARGRLTDDTRPASPADETTPTDRHPSPSSRTVSKPSPSKPSPSAPIPSTPTTSTPTTSTPDISTTTTSTPTTSTPSIAATVPAVVAPRETPRPTSTTIARSTTPPAPTPAAAPSAGARIHVVVAGDNLWHIARTEVARVSGSERVTDAVIAPYWQRIIEANRDALRSGDPNLIFPGERIALP